MTTDRPGNALGSGTATKARVVARALTKPPSPYRFEETELADVATRLYIRGYIDLNVTPGLRTDFEKAILGADSDVVLDCADMTYMDTGAILQLAELRDSLEASGRRLRVAAVSTDVARAIELLGLTRILATEEFLPTEAMPRLEMPQLEQWSPTGQRRLENCRDADHTQTVELVATPACLAPERLGAQTSAGCTTRPTRNHR